MRSAFVWAVTLTALTLSGCLGDFNNESSSLDAARKEAEGILDAATLIEIRAWEGAGGGTTPETDTPILADDRPGDGRAPTWAFRFQDGPDGADQLYVVVENGDVVATQRLPGSAATLQQPGPGALTEVTPRPLREWQSAATVAGRLDDREDWPSSPTSAAWRLYDDGDGPRWDVEVLGTTHATIYKVDATDASILEATERRLHEEACSFDQSEGVAGMGSTVQSTVESEGTGTIRAEVVWSNGIGTARASLSGGGEVLWSMEDSLTLLNGQSTSFEVTLRDQPAGTYLLEAEADTRFDAVLLLDAVWDGSGETQCSG